MMNLLLPDTFTIYSCSDLITQGKGNILETLLLSVFAFAYFTFKAVIEILRETYKNGCTVVTMSSANINPLTSRPGCMPGSRYTGVGALFFVI